MRGEGQEPLAVEQDAPPGRLAAIVLAAGRSRRMASSTPKVLHRILGIPLLEYVVLAARAAGCDPVVVVVAPDHREAIAAALAAYPEVRLAVQAEPRGTAHAVLAAREALSGFAGTAVVLTGDAPCVRAASLGALVSEHRARRASLSVLTGVVTDPTGYGRIVRGVDGEVAGIFEEKDASASVRAIREINSGVLGLELPALWDLLTQIPPSPATGELYLTEAVALGRQVGRRVVAVLAAQAEDVLGVNDRLQLARVTRVLRDRINERHMASGVTIVDPESAFIDHRAVLEQDVTIGPFVVIDGPCRVERGAYVGPFAHLRGGSRVGPGARVGNFVEVVRSSIGAEARALHLSYIGDGELADGVNVGAGTVLANWDGQRHHPSQVGPGACLGANTVLVAPSRVGAGARTGAGAVVVKTEVPAGATWVGVPAAPIHRSEGQA